MSYRPVILVCFQDTSEQAGIRCAVGTLIYASKHFQRSTNAPLEADNFAGGSQFSDLVKPSDGFSISFSFLCSFPCLRDRFNSDQVHGFQGPGYGLLQYI